MNPRPALTLRERYGRNRISKSFEEWPEHPPLIRVWIDAKQCLGFPFTKVVSIVLDGDRLAINVEKVGTFLIVGPKTAVFFEQFCEHAVSNLRAVAPDIVSVTYLPVEEEREI